MATYSNQHWLLSHIRNSFISTDDTGMCETVMVSDDLPKHFLRKFQSPTTTSNGAQQQPAAAGAYNQTNAAQRKPVGVNGGASAASVASGGNNGQSKNLQRTVADPPLQEVDFICYPGLDQSDDEDMDLSTQSFDIQMYPEVGAHRFRSNTAQKLEKMDIARRKAARTKCVNYDDEIIGPERNDLFVRKLVANVTRRGVMEKDVVDGGGASSSSDRCNTDDTGSESATPEKKLATNKKPAAPVIKSKLSLQLANSPKQSQNKFMEYARFDGTSQTGVKTKRISVFLSMLPEKKRNYPIKICVVESAKIIEVIGLVCYKATIQFPAIPLKSIRHYGLYMTEDNDDMDDFPPLDNREPCSKFGFSHLTLAERRPLASVTRIEFPPNNNNISSEDNRGQRSSVNTLMQPIDTNSINQDALIVDTPDGTSLNDEEQGHHERLEAPTYRTYRLHIIDKRFFKTEVTLGISGERIEIDQHKNPKFWTKQKAVTYPIEAIAFCEIVERRNVKAILRIWLKSSSSVNAALMAEAKAATLSVGAGGSGNVAGGNPLSPTSPGHYATFTSPFTKFSTIAGGGGGSSAGGLHSHIRFKHYDFEADPATAEQIHTKLNCILDVRSSDVRREFLLARERKLEKSQAKKQLKMF